MSAQVVRLDGRLAVFQVVKETGESPYTLHIKTEGKSWEFVISQGQADALDAASHDGMSHSSSALIGQEFGDR